MTARQSAAVDKALALVAKGLTPYAAAKKVGIALSTIYRAQKRLRHVRPDSVPLANVGSRLK